MRDADSGGWPRRLNMIGAIAGDIIGSVFEHNPIKTTTFPLFSQPSCFTDDTVLSVAVADAILNRTDYATALAIFLARQAAEKSDIRREIRNRFHYPLDRSLAEIRPHYAFDISCQGSVPESIVAFLESKNVEDAIRLADPRQRAGTGRHRPLRGWAFDVPGWWHAVPQTGCEHGPAADRQELFELAAAEPLPATRRHDQRVRSWHVALSGFRIASRPARLFGDR